ncbi:MAG: energy-coupling factor transporter ATPase, partial [Chloroflexota bacterium]|nr:energy-coupling factor transporter ATPase [Chloroflexota bacterium]
PREVFRQVDRLREIALDVPAAVDVADRLRRRGLPIGDGVLEPTDLRRALAPLVGRRPERQAS